MARKPDAMIEFSPADSVGALPLGRFHYAKVLKKNEIFVISATLFAC